MNRRSCILLALMSVLVFGSAMAADAPVVPRFVGEMRILPQNLKAEVGGNHEEFNAVYRWFDHGIEYNLISPPQGGESIGRVTLKLNPETTRGYDVLTMAFDPHWEGQTVTLTVDTPTGRKSASTTAKSRNSRHWVTVEIGDGGCTGIEIAIQSSAKGRFSGIIEDLILRDSRLYQAFQEHWQRYASVNWNQFLKPTSFEPTYKLTRGLLYADEDIEALRAHLAAHPDDRAELERKVTNTQHLANGKFVFPVLPALAREEYMPNGSYYIHHAGRDMAFTGLVCKDKAAMRKAATIALILASYENWDDRPIPDNTPGQWYETAFWPSFVTEAVALMLDYSGEMLTRDGYNFVLKQLYKKGVSEISYSLYSRPVYHNNQYVYFNSGRVAAMLMLEKSWPEIAASTDQAVELMRKSLDQLFRDDGSFKESTGYLEVVAPHAMRTYLMYAKARNKEVSEILPPNIRKSERYAQLIRSTSARAERSIIPIGDSGAWSLKPYTAAYLSLISGSGTWSEIYRSQPLPADDYPNWFLYNRLRESTVQEQQKEPFIFLPDSGLASSLRYWQNIPVKLLVVGYNDRGKVNEDVGSFTLEFAGESFAATVPNVRWGAYTSCQFQNMLVPSLKNAVPKYKQKLMDPTPMQAEGDEQRVRVALDLKNTLYENTMASWTRTFESASPGELLIRDTYATAGDASGVDFLWHTDLPVKVEGNSATIVGESGAICRLTAPEDCSIRTEQFKRTDGGAAGMGLPEDHVFTRIVIHKSEKQDTLQVRVQLTPPTQ